MWYLKVVNVLKFRLHKATFVFFLFTDQQAEIQKASMARLLCDNFGFARVHRNAFVRENV